MSKLSPKDIREALAATLKKALAAQESLIKDLREKELRRNGSLAKSEMCPMCGNPDRPDTCTCLQSLSKSALCKKCKKEHGFGKCDMSEIKPAKGVKNLEKDGAGGMDPSMAMTEKAEPTSVAQANKEMGGFKSIASSPTAMPSSKGPSLKPSKASGTIPVAKGEDLGTPIKPTKEIPTGDSGSNGNKIHASKEGAKLEKKSPPGKFNKLPEKLKEEGVPKKRAFAIAWSQKNKEDAKKSELAKDEEMSPAYANKVGIKGAPKPAKVGGKQPVGMGGGDAHKATGVHPETAAALADVHAVSPKAKSAGGFVAPSTATKAPVKGGEVNAPGSTGHNPNKDWTNNGYIVVAGGGGRAPQPASKWGASAAPKGNPAAISNVRAGMNAGRTAPKGNPAASAGVREKMNLDADKKAAGVGLIHNILSRFRKPQAVPAGSGAVRSSRFHGALPLQRSEGGFEKKDLDAKARAHIKPKNFAEPKDKKYPIEDAAHARNALSRVAQNGSPEEKKKVDAKVHAKYPGIGKAEGKSSFDLGNCLHCKKSEHGGLCKALAMTNHNRTMLRIGSAKSRKRK